MKDKDLEKANKMAKIISDTVEILEDDIHQREQVQIAISGIRQDISEYLTYNGYSEKMHDAILDIINKHSKL
jgi:hypothetical protein